MHDWQRQKKDCRVLSNTPGMLRIVSAASIIRSRNSASVSMGLGGCILSVPPAQKR